MLDHPKRSSERHCLCLQGCNVEPVYWAGTTLGLSYRAPLCLCSCVGKFSAPVLKMAIKIQQENRQLTTVLETTGKLKSSPKHWGKWVHVLVDWSLVLLASSDMLGLFVSSMWGTDLLHGTL